MSNKEIYNAIEHEVGISSYLSKEHPGFAAVLKARISDFVVHEVNRSGQIARLEHLSPPPQETKQHPSSSSPPIDEPEYKKRKRDPNEDPWEVTESQLMQWVPQDVAKQVMEMLKGWETNSSATTITNDTTISTLKQNVTLPQLADKDTRRAVHEFIKSELSHVALADTHNGCIRIWHKKFERHMPTFGKFDRGRNSDNTGKKQGQDSRPLHKLPWPPGRPDFLQFVLYKENIDTGTATKDILHRIHGKQVRLGYAGMKDKRGVTTQFCTLFKRHAEEIISFNNSQKNRGGGNSNYGNVSVIRVGNFEYVDKELHLGSLTGNRFDVVLRNVCVDGITTTSNTMEQTKATLMKAAQALGDNGFINYFGMQRFGRDQDTHKTGIQVLTGNFEEACRIIMKSKPNEPQQVERARKKWAERFDNMKEGTEKTDLEKSCASSVVRDMGRFMTCEVAILNSLKHRPLDYKRAFGTIPKHVRSMFLHAIQSLVFNRVASHRIEKLGRDVLVGDLVLVQDKDEQNGGSGTSGRQGKEVHVVTNDDKDKYALKDVVLPLVGSKVQYPENETGELFVSILAEIGLKKEDFSNIQDRDISLGGDYRKLICKPTDVDFQVVEYTDPLQPLLQTDLMKLDGSEIKLKEKDDTHENVHVGLVVGFTLPPSSYATICLRELMKRPTSVDYQRALQLSGQCEGKFETVPADENVLHMV